MGNFTITGLKQRLQAYSVASKSYGGKRLNRWEIYAAAAGSALALTTSADASIIYTLPSHSIVASPGPNAATNSAAFTIDGVPFHIAVQSAFSIFPPFHSTRIGDYLDGQSVLAAYSASRGVAAVRFATGQVISAGAGAYHVNQGTLRRIQNNAPSLGQFSNTGFAGVLVNGHPGWVRLQLSNLNSPNGTDLLNNGFAYGNQQLKVVDWAYDNSASTIRAGDTGPAATPEPGTAVLSLLPLGSIGALALRRRKKELDAKADTASS